jgi:hypothetical protein
VAETQIDFNAHAELRKWPSLKNERVPDGAASRILFSKGHSAIASESSCRGPLSISMR